MRHTQIFATAEVRKPLLTEARACEFLRQAITACKMQVIGGPWAAMGVVPGNEGVSATAILDFSSASLHEWPDRGLLTLDVFTCGAVPDREALEAIFTELEPVSLQLAIHDRACLTSS